MQQCCSPQGRLLRELQAFVGAAAEPGYVALPALAERAAAFQGDTHALVYDVLMLKVGALCAHPCLDRHPRVVSRGKPYCLRVTSVILQACMHECCLRRWYIHFMLFNGARFAATQNRSS